MGILGINNRTENWKTVQHFHGLPDAAKVGLVRRLGESKDTVAEEISIELFWRGLRDHAYAVRVEDGDLVEIYERRFCTRSRDGAVDLRDKIRKFEGENKFDPLQEWNYGLVDRKRLASNMKNTEVDIVLETPDRIFIGEAKDESDLGTNSDLVLVHQLIRQYVTVAVLTRLPGFPRKKIVPFVVADEGRLTSTNNKAQVEFMVEQKWLCRKNVLSWADLNDVRIGRG